MHQSTPLLTTLYWRRRALPAAQCRADARDRTMSRRIHDLLAAARRPVNLPYVLLAGLMLVSFLSRMVLLLR